MEAPLAFGLMPWEAVATFSGTAATILAGTAAVIAAYRVGMMQARISKLQAEILDQQARTDERRFQAELFERRMKVYLTLRDTIHIAATETAPLNQEIITTMFDRLDEARFIFPPRIFEFGSKITNLFSDLIGFRQTITAAKVTNDTKTILAEEVKIYKVKAELESLRDSMHELFKEEMHITHFASSPRTID